MIVKIKNSVTKNNMLNLSKNVKFLREKSRLTMDEFAKIIKIDKKYLVKAEAGKAGKYLYDVHLKNICDYFHVRVDDLFEEDFSMGASQK